MTYKVLIVTDSHLRDIDFKTMSGSKSAVEELFMDTLLDVIRKKSITHVIHTGDFIDKGYRNVGAALAHQSLIQHFADAVNGNLYMTIGNHFFREMLSNPELYWIQPHEKYKPNERMYAVEQLIKTPDTLILNKTQISLFHFNPKDKNYIRERQAGINYHVGIYHDDVCIPTSIRNEMHINVKSRYDYYSNIDLAIHGHIHKPQPITYVNGVPQIIPGSTALTSTGDDEFHDKVSLPILTIDEETCALSFITIPLGIHKYRFMKKKDEPTQKLRKYIHTFIDKEEQRESLKSITEFITSAKLPLHYISIIQRAASGNLTATEIVEEVLKNGQQQLDNFNSTS